MGTPTPNLRIVCLQGKKIDLVLFIIQLLEPRRSNLYICCRLIHTWETWKKSSIHSVCPWGQVRVKVLSPNPQLLRLGQLLAKPRGVVPNKYTKAFKLSTKLKSRSLLFFQTINHKLIKHEINIHHDI
jgi:hypothetical protein